jgi:hypothetical protein
MTALSRLVSLALFCYVTIACHVLGVEHEPDESNTAADKMAAALWVPPSASIRGDARLPFLVKDGRSVYWDGSGSVTFDVDTNPEPLSASVVAHFAGTEWQPRATQYLNPQMATSFERGWQSRCSCVIQVDANDNPLPHREYHEWEGEWQNARGDIVVYHLGGLDDDLHGYAEYVPHESVRSVTTLLQLSR